MLKGRRHGLSVFWSVMFALVFLIVPCPFFSGIFSLKCVLLYPSRFHNSDGYFDLRTVQIWGKEGWSILPVVRRVGAL